MLGALLRGRSSLHGCLRTIARPTSRQVAGLVRRSPPFQNVSLSSTIIKSFSSTPITFNLSATAQEISANEASTATPLITKFAELGEQNVIAQSVVDTLTDDMRLETMTPVQVQTINECLDGGDVIAQARTGTGKTLAFLIPTLQRIINDDPTLAMRGVDPTRRNKATIRALIISPTRELAEQIAEEARKVTRNTGVKVKTAVGGTSKAMGLRDIQATGCHILVGTPGRLNDILSDPDSGVRAPNLKVLVLDEADRLLDSGFGPEISRIEKLLPPREEVDRQTLMFSATVPEEVKEMVDSFMKPKYKFVQTIQAGEAQTHERVPQRVVVTQGLENTLPAIMELCKRELKERSSTERPFKAIVFFNANAEATLAAATFEAANRSAATGQKRPFHPAVMIEMHSRLSQAQRTRNAEAFRKATSGILFSSDVTARGMDFPNVTHVIQAGLPGTVDTYVHRLGRTARGDKSGEGWLLITPVEQAECASRLRGMRLNPDESLETAKVDMTQEAQLPAHVAEILTEAVQAAARLPIQMKSEAYRATLGAFQWFRGKQKLLDMMNNRSRFGWGLSVPPTISPKLAAKLGLARLQGINLGVEDRRDGDKDKFGGDRRSGFSERRGGGFGERRGGGFGERRGGGFGERRGGRSGEERGGRHFGASRDRESFRGDRGGYGDNKDDYRPRPEGSRYASRQDLDLEPRAREFPRAQGFTRGRDFDRKGSKSSYAERY